VILSKVGINVFGDFSCELQRGVRIRNVVLVFLKLHCPVHHTTLFLWNNLQIRFEGLVMSHKVTLYNLEAQFLVFLIYAFNHLLLHISLSICVIPNKLAFRKQKIVMYTKYYIMYKNLKKKVKINSRIWYQVKNRSLNLTRLQKIDY